MLFAIDWGQGFEDAWRDLTGFIPELIAAIVVLMVGWFVARIIRNVVEKILKTVKFDEIMDRSGIGGPVERAGYADSGKLLAQLIYYGVMLIVLQLAVNVFGDSAVEEAFDGLISFIPKLFIAIVIVIITGVIANSVRSLVGSSVAHLDVGPTIAKAAFAAIWVIGTFAAVDQLDVASDTVDTLWQTLAYSLGGILIIKFGVGGVWAARDRFWPAVYDHVAGVKEQHQQADGHGTAGQQPPAAPAGDATSTD